MPVTMRVRADSPADEYHNNCLICKKGNWFSIYADCGGYSQVSGQNIIKGNAKRGIDGTILKFASVQAAVEWMDNGELLIWRGKEFFDETGKQLKSKG